MIKNKKQMLLVISIFALILFLGGTTYAWFNYRSETSEQEIVAGEIYMHLNEGDEEIELSNIFPETKEEARARDDNYMTFEITGKNTSNKTIYYEFILDHGTDKESPKTRYRDGDLRFDLVQLDSNDEEVGFLLNNVSFDTLVNKRIYVDTVDASTTVETTRKYKLRMWLDENVIISDTDPNATYSTTEYKNKYATIKLTVVGDFQEKYFGYQKVLKGIESKQNSQTNSCNPTWTDTEDGIVYFSGTNNCVDMNYVWYSGKLWRITAIYPDGRMKLVTEDMITSILWGSSVEYDGSWVYQWLNEDFYNTLINPSSIIDGTSTWNYSEDGNSTPVRPETIATQKTKVAPIGLLNAYEYYNSYRCIGSATCTGSNYGTGYLNIGYNWWLITPYSASDVRYVNYDGRLSNYSPSGRAYGVRPSINLKSGLEFTGNGTKTSPYKIVGDKEDAVNNTTLLSDRSIGEYVKFDNDLYRIVDTNSGITKLTRVDYLRDSGTVINKYFASTVYYGKSTNTGTDTYWDYYLNNTWYNGISTTYKNMLVDGTYYLGLYPNNTNYKATICSDANLNSVTTSSCTKYTSSDTNKTWSGKVGLPRVGEMFSSQLGSGYSTSSNIWTITPYSTSYVRIVYSDGVLYNYSPSGDANGVRPSINLKSGIKITGGTGYVGGETNSPFEISE